MKKKVAIMLSGGLDSYLMYWYAKKNGYQPIPIRVDLGHPYASKEEEAIKGFEFADEVVHISMEDFVKQIPTNVDTKNQIIPGRNLLLGIIGANFAEEVWIGALHSEWHGKERDKSFKFFEDSTALLTYTFNVMRDRTELKTPFFHLTKSGLVEWALNNGITEEQMKKTVTCYDEGKGHCWRCSTCFKRWMAMANNGLSEHYDANPRESDYAKELMEEIRTGNKNKRLTPERIFEIEKALGTVGYVLHDES